MTPIRQFNIRPRRRLRDATVFAGVVIAVLFASAIWMHQIGVQHGFDTAMRTCPEAQGADKLLASVQKLDDRETLCIYTDSGTGYGSMKKRIKVRS